MQVTHLPGITGQTGVDPIFQVGRIDRATAEGPHPSQYRLRIADVSVIATLDAPLVSAHLYPASVKAMKYVATLDEEAIVGLGAGQRRASRYGVGEAG
jgi:hypothetical protein